MSTLVPAQKLTRKDFVSDQDVRWCPGCGDYAILATLQRTLPALGARLHNTVFVSGIGCSSRFPYYMNTYGFHSIHGRAPAIATGVKLANPELDVWVITGDGDGLSIGGNHMLHTLRRNVDVNILLFNNRIYGLTKGQYSPTSLEGLKTPSTPLGSVDHPVIPVEFALGSGAKFIARALDTAIKALGSVLTLAHQHRGSSFVEILQHCPVFHDDSWKHIADKSLSAQAQLHLEAGQPMRFGKDLERGLHLDPKSLKLEVVHADEAGNFPKELVVHDPSNRAMAFLLAALEPPTFPVALGVLYEEPAGVYEHQVLEQVTSEQRRDQAGDLQFLLEDSDTWVVD